MAVFISYAHADQRTLDRLLAHLQPLMRGEGAIDVWSDRRLTVSQDWRAEIQAEIARATIAILIVSADFYGSQFIVENELQPLLDRAQTGDCKIFCLLAGASPFSGDASLSRYQAMPPPDRTLMEQPAAKRDGILVDFCREISKSLSVSITGGRAVSSNTTPDVSRSVTSDNKSNKRFSNIDIDIVSLLRSVGDKRLDEDPFHHEWTILEGLTFENCNILGPAVLYVSVKCKFKYCTFGTISDDIDSVLYKSLGREYMFGIVMVESCNFIKCNFEDIGFTGQEAVLDALRIGIKGIEE